MATRHDTIEVIELEDGLSAETTKPPEKPQTDSDLESPAPTLSIAISDCISFTRHKGRYILAKQYRLKNSLLAGVGFLELANAGDFAANVWNEIPVPIFAVVLMAIGGTLALALSFSAFQDAILSRRNILLLRDERRYLQVQQAGKTNHMRHVQSQLDVNFRELGTELIDRIGMDIVMGSGAILVGIGTFLAIDGADPIVFQTSNLLSGYIGNVPVALYGLCNALWSAYVWRRAYRHGVAGAKALDENAAGLLLRRRVRTVKIHAFINGVAGTVAGAASIVTATMWYGYPFLAPCIILSVICNCIWRHGIG